MSTISKPKIIGILNLTEDSFSDGGKYVDIKDAIEHAEDMIRNGADIIDLGAESTKPGFYDVDSEIQLEKILPVINKIKKKHKSILFSVDTRSSIVAKEVLNEGASIINDVSSGTHDPKIIRVVADSNAKIIFTHMPDLHQKKKVLDFGDQLIKKINEYLDERVEYALSQGVERKNIIIDPGICYGKSGKDNVEIIKNIKSFVQNFKNVCIGVSNKKFSSDLFSGITDNELALVSLIVTTHCVIHGVLFLRVHDIIPNKDALEVAWKTHMSA